MTGIISSPIINTEGDLTLVGSDGTESVIGRVYRSGNFWVGSHGYTERKFKTHNGATDFVARQAFGW